MVKRMQHFAKKLRISKRLMSENSKLIDFVQGRHSRVEAAVATNTD